VPLQCSGKTYFLGSSNSLFWHNVLAACALRRASAVCLRFRTHDTSHPSRDTTATRTSAHTHAPPLRGMTWRCGCAYKTFVRRLLPQYSAFWTRHGGRQRHRAHFSRFAGTVACRRRKKPVRQANFARNSVRLAGGVNKIGAASAAHSLSCLRAQYLPGTVWAARAQRCGVAPLRRVRRGATSIALSGSPQAAHALSAWTAHPRINNRVFCLRLPLALPEGTRRACGVSSGCLRCRAIHRPRPVHAMALRVSPLLSAQ